jgi:hypothetical protein
VAAGHAVRDPNVGIHPNQHPVLPRPGLKRVPLVQPDALDHKRRVIPPNMTAGVAYDALMVMNFSSAVPMLCVAYLIFSSSRKNGKKEKPEK